MLDAPCNQYPTLQWNAQINLAAVPVVPITERPERRGGSAAGSGRTVAPGVGATYQDTSNDLPDWATTFPSITIPAGASSGRCLRPSPPRARSPRRCPINGASAAATEPVPEISEPFLVPTGSYWTAP